MASARQKKLSQQESKRWRNWQRSRQDEAVRVLGLLHLANQIIASGSVLTKKP